MSDLRLPVLEGDISPQDALPLMAETGAVAVRDTTGVRLVTARMTLDEFGSVNVGEIADVHGIIAERLGEIIDDSGTHLTVRFDRCELPLFEVPAGYLQCRRDANHTYDLMSGLQTCPVDTGVLDPVYLEH